MAGLLKTPERVAKAMLTLTRGYEQDPHAILLGARSEERRVGKECRL